MDNVMKLINSLNISKNEYIVVACSGGPDSMYLLNLLNALGYKCVCAHVNHNMREASKSEYKFLNDYCDNSEIIFEGTEITEYSDDNFHNDARIFRYNFFESLIKKYDAKYLFTAHHGDDLIETILMRIVRGSTLKGYRGFDAIVDKDSYKIIRPLIYLTKEEIENSCRDISLKYVIDESNLEDHYTRNRYRHNVLPFFKSEDYNVHQKFLCFNELLKDASDYIERQVESYFNDVYVDNSLIIDKFLKLETFIQKQVLMNIISFWYPDDLFLINENHLVEVMKMIKSDKPNIKLVLPNSVIVIKEYNKVLFSKNSKIIDDYEYVFVDSVNLPKSKIIKVDTSDDTSNYVIRLNSADVKLPLKVRTRLDGDKMQIKNMSGRKKINDIFIDSKISMDDRKVWPIVTDSENKILWLPGLKKSNFDVPINGLYDIILKYEKGEE